MLISYLTIKCHLTMPSITDLENEDSMSAPGRKSKQNNPGKLRDSQEFSAIGRWYLFWRAN